jgi:hypothetical protein
MNKQRLLQHYQETPIANNTAVNDTLIVRIKSVCIVIRYVCSKPYTFASGNKAIIHIEFLSHQEFRIPTDIKAKSLTCECTNYAQVQPPPNTKIPILYSSQLSLKTPGQDAAKTLCLHAKLRLLALSISYGLGLQQTITRVIQFIESV